MRISGASLRLSPSGLPSLKLRAEEILYDGLEVRRTLELGTKP
jgi:hypothetical protein